MKTLCIVPARGGSKRLPNKNIKDLCGKPLINYTIDVVTKYFSTIIVSTDSDKILEKIHLYDNVVPLLRPNSLATDTAKVLQTVEWIFDNLKDKFEQIWLCLPTCPLRSEQDVKNAKKLLDKNTDNIVSITDFEFPPTLGLEKNDFNIIIENNKEKPFANNNTRSQDHKTIYRPNGAMYGSWYKSFKNYRNFFKGIVKGYYMPRERSVDIDNLIDLKIAEIILKGVA